MMNRIRNLVDSLSNKNRKDQELNKQWLGQLNLPPRETESELPKRKGTLYEQWVQEGSLAPEDMPQASVVSNIIQAKKEADPLLSTRLMRYVIIEGGVILVLLIALAVVITLLVIK
jgi:hypothetical protein